MWRSPSALNSRNTLGNEDVWNRNHSYFMDVHYKHGGDASLPVSFGLNAQYERDFIKLDLTIFKYFMSLKQEKINTH